MSLDLFWVSLVFLDCSVMSLIAFCLYEISYGKAGGHQELINVSHRLESLLYSRSLCLLNFGYYLQNKSKMKGCSSLCFYDLENKSNEIWTVKKYRTILDNHWILDKLQSADMVLILGSFLQVFFVFISGKHFLVETYENDEIKWVLVQ